MSPENAKALKERQEAMSVSETQPELPPPDLTEESYNKAHIEFDKIKNLEALEIMDREGSKIVKEKRKSTLRNQKSKFSFLEPVQFDLPSRGKFYQDSPDENLKHGIIFLRPMGMVDEEIMTNPVNLKSGTAIQRLFDSCMASDYEADKLLTFDATYLLYALRKESYGDEYSFEIECPDCGRKFEETVRISDLSFAEMPEGIEEPFVIRLPVSKYSVTMCLPRMHHTEYLYRLTKENEDVPERILSFITQTLSIKDQRNKDISPNDYIDFYTALPANDRAAISDSLKFDTGVDKIHLVCPNARCAKEFKESVPFGLSFFRLN